MLGQVKAFNVLGTNELHAHFAFLLILVGIFLFHFPDLTVLSARNCTGIHNLAVLLFLFIRCFPLLSSLLLFILLFLLGLFLLLIAAFLLRILLELPGRFANLDDCNLLIFGSTRGLLKKLVLKIVFVFTHVALTDVIG